MFPGLKLKHILKRCHEASAKNNKDMQQDLKDVAQTIYDYTILPSGSENRELKEPKSLGSGLVLSYLIIKILNFCNVLFNLWLMDSFVSRNQSSWILSVLSNLSSGFKWEMPDYFPRVS